MRWRCGALRCGMRGESSRSMNGRVSLTTTVDKWMEGLGLLERRIWGNTVIRSVMNDVSAVVGTDVINELLRGTTHFSFYPFLRYKPLFLLFSSLLALSSPLYVMVTVWEHYSSTYCFVFPSSVRVDAPGKSTTDNLLNWETCHHFPDWFLCIVLKSYQLGTYIRS